MVFTVLYPYSGHGQKVSLRRSHLLFFTIENNSDMGEANYLNFIILQLFLMRVHIFSTIPATLKKGKAVKDKQSSTTFGKVGIAHNVPKILRRGQVEVPPVSRTPI